MKKFILIPVICLSILGGATCASKMPPSYTPQTKQLYILTDVVNGIGTLQVAAENAVPAKILSVNSARVIVQFCVSANTTIGQTPNGWYTVVNTAYLQAKKQLTVDEQTKFSGYLIAFEIILNSFLGQQQ
jgi:hypothetical protein